MQTASQMFEAEAERWEKTRRMQKGVSNAYGMATLRLWIASKGAKSDGVSERLKRYQKAAEKSFERQEGPDWYERFLRVRSACSICGEGFRIENLGLCTHCDARIGYCHQFKGGVAPNGNLKCPKCEAGETVG